METRGWLDPRCDRVCPVGFDLVIRLEEVPAAVCPHAHLPMLLSLIVYLKRDFVVLGGDEVTEAVDSEQKDVVVGARASNRTGNSGTREPVARFDCACNVPHLVVCIPGSHTKQLHLPYIRHISRGLCF